MYNNMKHPYCTAVEGLVLKKEGLIYLHDHGTDFTKTTRTDPQCYLFNTASRTMDYGHSVHKARYLGLTMSRSAPALTSTTVNP